MGLFVDFFLYQFQFPQKSSGPKEQRMPFVLSKRIIVANVSLEPSIGEKLDALARSRFVRDSDSNGIRRVRVGQRNLDCVDITGRIEVER